MADILNVNITFPDGTTIHCGEIVTTDPDERGRVQGAFRYTREFLNHPEAFSLDPVNLPLTIQELPADHPCGVHSVFQDALPDAWGKKLLIKKANLSRKNQTVTQLLKVMGSTGLGALSFYENEEFLNKKDVSVHITNLKDLVNAAVRFDSGFELQDNEIELLFLHASSPGGARPKGLVKKDDNSLWIAKFPMSNDKYNVEAIEAATLELARNSGLVVPDFELQTLGKRKALLVKRFDVSETSTCYHMISMYSLMQADDYYYVNYSDLFDIVRRYSYHSVADVPMLYHQMVFNAAIGNTDDHLKNFCMLHTKHGYTLSPAYDLLPDIHGKREHVLSFPQGSGSFAPGRNAFLFFGENQKIKNPDKIIDSVFTAVSDWQKVFRKYEVPEQDINKLKWSIERRLDSLCLN